MYGGGGGAAISWEGFCLADTCIITQSWGSSGFTAYDTAWNLGGAQRCLAQCWPEQAAERQRSKLRRRLPPA